MNNLLLQLSYFPVQLVNFVLAVLFNHFFMFLFVVIFQNPFPQIILDMCAKHFDHAQCTFIGTSHQHECTTKGWSHYNMMATCRICYEPDNLESLCECRGTAEFVHLKCVEHWIKVSNRKYCELCHSKYRLAEPKPSVIKNQTWETLQILFFAYIVLGLAIVLFWSVLYSLWPAMYII